MAWKPLEFLIPYIPLTANKLRHLHWAAKRREVLRWRSLLIQAKAYRGPFTDQAQLVRAKDGKIKKKTTRVGTQLRASVCISILRKRLQDRDNLSGSIKPVLDALVQEGWLWDDSRKWIDLDVNEELAGKQPEATRILVEYLEV